MMALLRRGSFPGWGAALVALCIVGFASDALAQALPKISLQVEDAQQGDR